MFDWNEQDQVGYTIWDEFSGNEDHIVPYPKGTEDNTLVPFGEHDKKKRNEDTGKTMGFNKHTSVDKTNFQGCNVANQSAFQTNEELLAPQLDMETWPDLPSLNAVLDGDYNTGSDQEAMATAHMDGFSTTNLEEVRVQLDGEPEVFGDGHEDKSNSFLDCDWGNIGDFDDFDRLFSNSSSIFCDEMVGNGEFLSTSSDVISSTMQSIPMPGGVQKRTVKSLKKAEEKAHYKDIRNLITVSPHNINRGQHSDSSAHPSAKTPLQAFQTTGVSHIQVGNVQNIEQPGHSNQFVFSGYGYSGFSIPTTLLTPNVQADCKTFQGSSKHTVSLDSLPDVPLRPLMMTPQEKIEKLRRRQQMQAMLAIQQQQQQFGGVSSADTLVPQSCSPRKQNSDLLAGSIVEDIGNKALKSELKVLAAQDESRNISVLRDDPYLQESMYYQLQDALGKLDNRVLLCIRDSLLRLAQCAMQRQSASNRSSTNKSNRNEDEVSENDDGKRRTRCTKLGEAETDTNPLDRIVAHLLFHTPSEMFATTIKEESPPSPVSFDPVARLESIFESPWKYTGEKSSGHGRIMEVQTSL